MIRAILGIALLISIILAPIIMCYHEDYDYYKKCNFNSNNLPIKFSQFISLYNIAPQKWKTPDDKNVIYQNSPECLKKTFYFSSAKDLKKYEKWFENRAKFEKDLRDSKSMQTMIEFWQKDIEECAEKGRQMLDKSLNI